MMDQMRGWRMMTIQSVGLHQQHTGTSGCCFFYFYKSSRDSLKEGPSLQSTPAGAKEKMTVAVAAAAALIHYQTAKSIILFFSLGWCALKTARPPNVLTNGLFNNPFVYQKPMKFCSIGCCWLADWLAGQQSSFDREIEPVLMRWSIGKRMKSREKDQI